MKTETSSITHSGTCCLPADACLERLRPAPATAPTTAVRPAAIIHLPLAHSSGGRPTAPWRGTPAPDEVVAELWRGCTCLLGSGVTRSLLPLLHTQLGSCELCLESSTGLLHSRLHREGQCTLHSQLAVTSGYVKAKGASCSAGHLLLKGVAISCGHIPLSLHSQQLGASGCCHAQRLIQLCRQVGNRLTSRIIKLLPSGLLHTHASLCCSQLMGQLLRLLLHLCQQCRLLLHLGSCRRIIRPQLLSGLFSHCAGLLCISQLLPGRVASLLRRRQLLLHPLPCILHLPQFGLCCVVRFSGLQGQIQRPAGYGTEKRASLASCSATSRLLWLFSERWGLSASLSPAVCFISSPYSTAFSDSSTAARCVRLSRVCSRGVEQAAPKGCLPSLPLSTRTELAAERLSSATDARECSSLAAARVASSSSVSWVFKAARASSLAAMFASAFFSASCTRAARVLEEV
ncbi:hypothetical protein ACK3TF_000220 [Chlorella vulgaris]